MTYIEQLEYPLPIVKTDIDRLNIEVSSSFEGSFLITNAGGGELEGKITSNLRGLTFSAENFKGNKININYKLNATGYKKGDLINTSALIMSNGGEIIIPVTLHIIAPAIMTKDAEQITTLKDFMFYTKKEPLEARRIFSQKEFLMWLMNINYENMDMYEHFNKDPNKERAVDNFLVLNGLKNKAEMVILDDDIKIIIKPSESEPITGVIPIQLRGWGYVDGSVIFEDNADFPWIKLITSKITSADFDEEGFFEASFIIYPNLIKQKAVFSKVKLCAKQETDIYINVCKEDEFYAKLDRLSYLSEDDGNINIENKTDKDLMIEVYSEDGFLKFEGRRYLINAYAQIPFHIKLTSIQRAQYALKKQMIIETEVTLRTYVGEKRIDKVLKVSIGSLYE